MVFDTTPLPRLGLPDLQPVLASSSAGSDRKAHRLRAIVASTRASSLRHSWHRCGSDLPWRKVRS